MKNSEINIENNFAVITGASSGIGKAISIALAKKKVNLCLLGRNKSNLDNTAEIARKTSSQVICYPIDLTIDKKIAELADFIQQNTGNVDMLIHCAGVIKYAKLESASADEFDYQYKVNVRSPFILTQRLLPMLRTSKGQIVFINSSAGLNTGTNIGHYAATKHALKAITDSLRLEENKNGIRILSIYPGRTATPMQENVFKMEGKAEYHPELLIQPADIASVVINALILPKSAEITDISIRSMIKSD